MIRNLMLPPCIGDVLVVQSRACAGIQMQAQALFTMLGGVNTPALVLSLEQQPSISSSSSSPPTSSSSSSAASSSSQPMQFQTLRECQEAFMVQYGVPRHYIQSAPTSTKHTKSTNRPRNIDTRWRANWPHDLGRGNLRDPAGQLVAMDKLDWLHPFMLRVGALFACQEEHQVTIR